MIKWGKLALCFIAGLFCVLLFSRDAILVSILAYTMYLVIKDGE